MGRCLHFLDASNNRQLFVVAVASRLALTVFVVVVGWLLPDYDESARLNDIDLRHASAAAAQVDRTRPAPALPMLWHWDAVHFRHIADYGYSHESTTAFFPLIPLMIRILEQLVPSAPFVTFSALQMLLFGCSAVAMRHVLRAIVDLGKDLFIDDALAGLGRKRRRDAIAVGLFFYLTSPASIFTVVSYTETVYVLLSFYAMLLCYKGWAQASGLLFGLSTLARSNGILAAPYIVLDTAKELLYNEASTAAMDVEAKRWRPYSTIQLGRRPEGVLEWTAAIVSRGTAALYAVAPYLAVNFFHFQRFCRVTEPHPVAVALRDRLMSGLGHPRSLDADSSSDDASQGWFAAAQTMALRVADAVLSNIGVAAVSRSESAEGFECPPAWYTMYADVQRRHWGLGWFTYWQLHNTHNFCIAAPLYFITAVSFVRCWIAAGASAKRSFFRRVGRLVVGSPHTMWLLMMLSLAVSRMHIQVTVRFVFVCPAFYLITAAAAVRLPFVWYYQLLYASIIVVLSPVLFANFYPWT